MKLSVNKGFSLIRKIWATVFIMMIIPAPDCFAQKAELQLNAQKNNPFFLFINGQSINSRPLASVGVTGLKGEQVNIRVLFADTLAVTLTDSILLEEGYLMIFDILRYDTIPVNAPKKFFDNIRNRFIQPQDSTDLQPKQYTIRPHSRIIVSEIMDPIIMDTFQSKTDTIRPPGEPVPVYYFTKEQAAARKDQVMIHPDGTQRVDSLPESVQDSIRPAGSVKPGLSAWTDSQHKQLLTRLSELTFEEDRIQAVMKSFNHVTLSAQHLYEILLKFDFERSKLQLCKGLYQKIKDKENTELLYKAFEFQTTRDELKNWIHEQSG